MTNVVDLSGVRIARDAGERLDQQTREFLREAMEHIAELHGELPDDWVDRKSMAAGDVIASMREASAKAVSVSLPEDLSAEERTAIIDAMRERIREHAEACIAAFLQQLFEILRP